jgi:hypothetical protein
MLNGVTRSLASVYDAGVSVPEDRLHRLRILAVIGFAGLLAGVLLWTATSTTGHRDPSASGVDPRNHPINHPAPTTTLDDAGPLESPTTDPGSDETPVTIVPAPFKEPEWQPPRGWERRDIRDVAWAAKTSSLEDAEIHAHLTDDHRLRLFRDKVKQLKHGVDLADHERLLLFSHLKATHSPALQPLQEVPPEVGASGLDAVIAMGISGGSSRYRTTTYTRVVRFVAPEFDAAHDKYVAAKATAATELRRFLDDLAAGK